MKAVGITVTAIAGLTLSAIWSGYVLSVLWVWFVATQFEAAPRLTIPGAIGLALIVSYLTYHHDDRIEDQRSTSDRIYAMVGAAIGKPLFALAIGWIVHLFV